MGQWEIEDNRGGKLGLGSRRRKGWPIGRPLVEAAARRSAWAISAARESRAMLRTTGFPLTGSPPCGACLLPGPRRGWGRRLSTGSPPPPGACFFPGLERVRGRL